MLDSNSYFAFQCFIVNASTYSSCSTFICSIFFDKDQTSTCKEYTSSFFSLSSVSNFFNCKLLTGGWVLVIPERVLLPVLVVAYLLLVRLVAVFVAVVVVQAGTLAFIGDLLGVVTLGLACLVLIGDAVADVGLPVTVLVATAGVALVVEFKNFEAPLACDPLKLLFLELSYPVAVPLDDKPPDVVALAPVFMAVEVLVVVVVPVAPIPVVLLTPVAVYRLSLSLASYSFF